MGIDAEMLIRHRGQPLSTIEVNRLGVALAEAFGRKRFFAECPADPDYEGWDGDYTALELVECWEQDGPTLFPEDDEQFIRVHLWSRYYGEGYERGDWPFISNVRKWLLLKLPAAEIWYGGDSSGVEAKPLTDEMDEELWSLFAKAGHAWAGYFEEILDQSRDQNVKPICPMTELPLQQSLFSGDGHHSAYRCAGCDCVREFYFDKEVESLDEDLELPALLWVLNNPGIPSPTFLAPSLSQRELVTVEIVGLWRVYNITAKGRALLLEHSQYNEVVKEHLPSVQ